MRSGLIIRQLTPGDVALMRSMMTMFGGAFDEVETYSERRPSSAYLELLLRDHHFIAVAAITGGAVIGGLTCYELQKYEQERSEIYIYDLAVSASERRKGIATALIERTRTIAEARGAYVMFIQADRADLPAVGLYSKFGARSEVHHFDIKLDESGGLRKR